MDQLNVRIAEDYSLSQVPKGEGKSGLHLALIIVGGTIGMSIFIMAAQVGSSLGLLAAGKAFMVGSLILGSLGSFTSYVGYRSRYSTYKLAEFCFGWLGAKLVNGMIALTLVGWFAVISSVFGDAATTIVADSLELQIPAWVFVLLISLLIIFITIMGFEGIDKLALYLVPVMILFIAYAAWLSWGQIQSWVSPVVDNPAFDYNGAISAIVGSYIVGVVIQPDFSRFAKSATHAIWSIFLALGIVFPLIQFFAAVPSIATDQGDLILIMIALGIGVPAFLLLFLGAWSSNVLCLYSSSLSFSTIFQRFRLSIITISLGLVGTVFALLEAHLYFIDYLVFLSVAIPPIAAIYVLDAFAIRRLLYSETDMMEVPSVDWRACVAWLAASVFAWNAGHLGFSLTNIAALDSIFVGAILFLILNANRLVSKNTKRQPIFTEHR